MHEQGQHQRDQVDGRAQPVERGALGRGEGLATAFAVIALLFLAQDPNIACAQLASCWTLQVVAELGLRRRVLQNRG